MSSAWSRDGFRLKKIPDPVAGSLENRKKTVFQTAESIGLKLIACLLLGQGMVSGSRKTGFCSQFVGKPAKTGLANSSNSTVLTQCVIHYIFNVLMMGKSFLISDLSNSKVYPAGSGKKPAKPEKFS